MNTNVSTITIMQAARLLGKNYMQVYKMVSCGDIKAVQEENGHWLLSYTSIMHRIDSGNEHGEHQRVSEEDDRSLGGVE